jgi:hypothetical protein
MQINVEVECPQNPGTCGRKVGLQSTRDHAFRGEVPVPLLALSH